MQMQREFPREIGALEAIFVFVGEFFVAMGRGDSDTSAVELIIEEIFTNMVKYSLDGRRPIEVRLRQFDDAVEIGLTDFDVAPFDYSKAPEVDPQELLAQRRSGGLGLHLVQKMADHVSYAYVDRSNMVTIVKKLGD
jgi:anti-sigma regulatory factor (Ser/Thr protein kinase)